MILGQVDFLFKFPCLVYYALWYGVAREEDDNLVSDFLVNTLQLFTYQIHKGVNKKWVRSPTVDDAPINLRY